MINLGNSLEVKPTAFQIGSAVYALMVADILCRSRLGEDTPKDIVKDIVSFRAFSSQVLKLNKKDLPVELTQRLDKCYKAPALLSTGSQVTNSLD